MFTLSSLKTIREAPSWILIIILINLAFLNKPVEAFKCYRCSCWNDCVSSKNLFREVECAPGENACFTQLPANPGENYISKKCVKSVDKESDARNGSPGRIYKYCYTELCNDQEAGGIKNPNPRSDQSNSGDGLVARAKMTSHFVPPAMIMSYVGRWLIN